MLSLSAAVYVLLLGLSAAVTGVVARYAWRRREEPGARPFAGFMATVTVWSVCAAATMLTRDPGTHALFERIIWMALAFVPVFWIWFALAYIGYDEFVSGRTLLLLSVIPLVSSVLGLLPPFQHLVWTVEGVYVFQGVATAGFDAGILYWVTVLYGYGLILVGMALLVWLVVVSDYLFADQAALLIVGIVVAFAGSLLTLFGVVPVRGFSYTPYAFAATGISFGYALFRQRLFELLPATRRLGRDTAIATLDDGILILDNNYHVIYLNPEAADVLDCEVRSVLGTPAADLIDTADIEFDVPDALAELHIEGRFYEARTSTITDRTDRGIGYTLVLHDVTARKRRERRLRRQRDELEALDRLNELVRETTQSFASATSRSAIEETVRERFRASTLYVEANVVVDPTDEIVAGDGGVDAAGPGAPMMLPAAVTVETASPVPEVLPDVLETEHGSWAVVPLGYGKSIYGALVVYATRADAFASRELAVLGQFGDTLSQAIDAVENRRLLLADTIVELEFRCPDAALVDVATGADSRLSLAGLVPASEDELLVYCRTDGSPERVVDAAEGVEGIASARIADGATDAAGVVEFVLTDRSALLALSAGGVNVHTAEATDEYRVVVEVVPETDVRALTERVREFCPGTTLAARRDLDRPIATDHRRAAPADALAELTDRQREVLEAAYRAGYFRWPRDRTAEEVAESIDISSPTLHKHLRRAEERLFEEMFDATDADRPRER